MEQYLIDTNIISHYLTSEFPEKGLSFLDNIFDAVPNISVITQIEILCWKSTDAIETLVKDLINDSKVFELDNEVINHCISIRRKKSMKTPDAIIAATALANNFILITSNEKDFQNIKGLKIMNPHKL